MTRTLIIEEMPLPASVQAVARVGFRRYGVPEGGALDLRSASVAPLLVGNSLDQGLLELAGGGGTFRIRGGYAVVAVTGGAAWMEIDGDRLATWRSHLAHDGCRIVVGPPETGLRSYLAVAGGFDLPVVLGSRSTDLRGCFGGYHGRWLRGGEELPLGPAREVSRGGRIASPDLHRHLVVRDLAFVPGEWWEELEPESRRRLLRDPIVIAARSDRAGVRFAAPALAFSRPVEVRSHPVLPGALQVTASGEAIVLMRDAGTTGGYPVIGHVAQVDLDVLAQRGAGEEIRFHLSTVAREIERVRDDERALALFAAGIDTAGP